MTCFVPSDRLIVPRSLAVTPVPAVGAPVVVSGGHAVAHAPEHVDFVLVSGTHKYSERPELSVRKLVPPLVCTSTVIADELAPAADDTGEAGAEEEWPELCELQAPARTAAAARGAPTLSASEALLDESKLFIYGEPPSDLESIPEWKSGVNTSVNTSTAQKEGVRCLRHPVILGRIANSRRSADCADGASHDCYSERCHLDS